MFLRITPASLSHAAVNDWNNSYRTRLGTRSWQKTLQSQPFPTVFAIHSRSAQDCSYAGVSSLWPCALPIELPWVSATEQSCRTKGQDLKQLLAFGVVRCVTSSVPVPAEQKRGFIEHQKGLSLPINSQAAESSALAGMRTEPEMLTPIISQTGTRPIEHIVNDQRPKKDYLL